MVLELPFCTRFHRVRKIRRRYTDTQSRRHRNTLLGLERSTAAKNRNVTTKLFHDFLSERLLRLQSTQFA